MEFIKKFAKEISVFGLVIVIFLGLFVYRQMTFKDYKTIQEKQLTQMVKDKKDFVVVAGSSTDASMQTYQEIMTKYTTKNRSTPFYYIDTSKMNDAQKYIEETFNESVSYPVTFVVNDGKVTAKREGALQYYSLYDFVKENLNK